MRPDRAIHRASKTNTLSGDSFYFSDPQWTKGTRMSLPPPLAVMSASGWQANLGFLAEQMEDPAGKADAPAENPVPRQVQQRHPIPRDPIPFLKIGAHGCGADLNGA